MLRVLTCTFIKKNGGFIETKHPSKNQKYGKYPLCTASTIHLTLRGSQRSDWNSTNPSFLFCRLDLDFRVAELSEKSGLVHKNCRMDRERSFVHSLFKSHPYHNMDQIVF